MVAVLPVESVNCERYRTLLEKNFIVGPVVLEHVNCESHGTFPERKFIFYSPGMACDVNRTLFFYQRWTLPYTGNIILNTRSHYPALSNCCLVDVLHSSLSHNALVTSNITTIHARLSYWSRLQQSSSKDCNLKSAWTLTDLLTYLLHGVEAFLRSYPVFSQSRNSPHFMEPEGSLPHSQVPAIRPYPEPPRSSPYTHIPLPEDPS